MSAQGKKRHDHETKPEAGSRPGQNGQAPEASGEGDPFEEAQASARSADVSGTDAPGGPAAPGETEGTGQEDHLQRIAALEDELATVKDQLLRALAETENVRRRGEREREEAVKYASVPLIRDLLGVADNLERAVESVPGDGAGDNETVKTLLTGVTLTLNELRSAFERHGIEAIEPLGEKLDPHRHEAMFEVPDNEHAPGTIVQVLQKGYKLRERLIRPARVGVAKASPRPAEESPGASPEDETPPKPGSRIDTKA